MGKKSRLIRLRLRLCRDEEPVLRTKRKAPVWLGRGIFLGGNHFRGVGKMVNLYARHVLNW